MSPLSGATEIDALHTVTEEAPAPPIKKPTGTYRMSDFAPVPVEEAKVAWAEQARATLLETAGTYHAVITNKELAEQVQAGTGIRTSVLLMNWIGGVLTLVAEDCGRRGEPLLSSLSVKQDGTVGDGYGQAVQSVRGTAPDDNDDHAAAERLACYRTFGADLPADGGWPALTPQVQTRRNRAAAARPVRRGQPCPRCFVEVPVSGTCMSCEQ